MGNWTGCRARVYPCALNPEVWTDLYTILADVQLMNASGAVE